MFALRAQCARIVAVNARRSSALQVLAASRLLKNGSSPRLLSPAHQPSVLMSNHSIPQPKWFTGLPNRVKLAIVGLATATGTVLYHYQGLKPIYTDMKDLMQDKSIRDLPQRPQHPVQPRPEVKELEKMFESLQKKKAQDVANTVYITGIPARGKTELARQFGEEYYRKNTGYVNKKVFVGTLNAKSPSELLQSCCQLAQALGCEKALVLEASKGDPNTLNVLLNAMGKELKKRPGWLLIVDNLSSAVKNNWNFIWPQPGDKRWGKGCVLVTTQDRNLVGDSSPFVKELYLSEGMSESDAVELLKEMSGCSDEGAKVVVNSRSVDRVPLSVASVGLYMTRERSRNPSFSFKDYLKLIERVPIVQEESEKMLQKEQQGVYPYTTQLATTMAAEQMAKDDPNLYKGFTLLATCDQSPVPMGVVARVLEVQPGINNTVLESVRKCPLLSSHAQGDIETVSVHQIRKDVFKGLFLRDTSTGTQQQRNDLLRHIMDCLSQEYEMAHISGTVSSYRMRMLLLPHMEGLLQVSTTVSGFQLDANREMVLCSWLGDGYNLVGRYREAKDVLERAQRVCEGEGGKETELASRIAVWLGDTYKHLAMYKESKSILKEVLAIREQQHGDDSVEVANALKSLGNTYHMMGQVKKSRECYERAFQIYRQTHGHKHSTVAMVLNNLGNTWLDLGDFAKSKELYEEALAIKEEIYGHDHPEVAATCNNLGIAYRNLGEYHKSIEMYERSLKIDKGIYGEDHDGVATTLINLGAVYYHLGDVHKSKEYAEEGLKKTEAIHGPRHPEVAIALQHLGMNHMGLEELDNAQQYLQRSVEIFKEMIGPKHPYTINTQRLLGEATRLAGSLEDARQILESTLETQESISSDLGGKIPLVLICWELGRVYRELGYHTQSVHTLRRSLDMLKQLNPNHPQVPFIQADLARVLCDAGEVKTGIDLMREALTVSQSTTYTDIDDLIYNSSMLSTMGLMLRETGELSQARKYLEDSLRNQEKLQLPLNLLKAETMGILGTVLHRLGTSKPELNPITSYLKYWYYRYQARKHLDSALEIMKRVRYNHPKTATILAAIGRMHMDMGEFPSARDHLEEALRIQSECCGSTDIHPDIALYHTLLAEITSGESATNHREKADKIYRALLKREGVGTELPVLQEWRKGLLTKGTNDDDSLEQN